RGVFTQAQVSAQVVEGIISGREYLYREGFHERPRAKTGLRQTPRYLLIKSVRILTSGGLVNSEQVGELRREPVAGRRPVKYVPCGAELTPDLERISRDVTDSQ